jgi:hypothetical protein
MTLTVSIAIGRNQTLDGHKPHNDDDWAQYKLSVMNLFTMVYTDTHGIGQYNGHSEDVAVFTGRTDMHVEKLRAALARLARLYNQESIGLIATSDQDTLVFAEPKKPLASLFV